jgi:hypothetical protein
MPDADQPGEFVRRYLEDAPKEELEELEKLADADRRGPPSDAADSSDDR